MSIRALLLNTESDRQPSTIPPFHVKAIGAVAKFDALLPDSSTNDPNISSNEVRGELAHHATRELARSAVTSNGKVVALFGILENLGDRQQVWPIVNARTKPDAVTGQIVGIHGAQARIVPSIDR